MGKLLKCVSGAAETCKFNMYVHRICKFYCVSVQFMQFPVLDFEVLTPSIKPCIFVIVTGGYCYPYIY